MGRSALREMAHDRRSACLVASLSFGLVSLYAGLYGAGTAWTTVSAVTGTISLGLAVLPTLKLTSESHRHAPRGEGANLLTNQSSVIPPEPVTLLKYFKTLLSDQRFIARAKRLRGRKAQLVITYLRKILALGGDALDSHCRSTAVELLFELVHSDAVSPSAAGLNRRVNGTTGTVWPVRTYVPPGALEATREIQAFRSVRHLNLEVFREERTGPPREAGPYPRLGVDSAGELSTLDIIAGIAASVAYLHSLDVPIVHGDIRAANIHIDPEYSAAVLELPYERWTHRASTTYHITHNDISRHLAPEQIALPSGSAPAWSQTISKSADIYALGMTLLELMTGSSPFAEINNPAVVVRAVQDGNRPSIPARSLARVFSAFHSSSSSESSAFDNNDGHYDLERGRAGGHFQQSQSLEDGLTGQTSLSTPIAGEQNVQVPPAQLRVAMSSLAALLEMMWAQHPNRRPSAQQVESRFEELAQFENIA